MRKQLFSVCVLLGLAALITAVVSASSRFSAWIADAVSLPFGRLIGQASDLISFPLFECLILLLGAAGLIFLIRALKGALTSRALRPVGRFLLHSLTAVAVLLLSYSILWSPLYNMPSASAEDTGGYTTEELSEVCQGLISRANTLSAATRRSEGRFLLPYSKQTALTRVSSAYRALETVDAEVRTPKLLRYSELFRAFHIAGLYAPWTGEALVSASEPDITLPFTASHEAAHSLGIAKEDEANFMAYLACMQGDIAFRYSGTMSALRYAMNDLRAKNPVEWNRIIQQMNEAVHRDFYSMNGLGNAKTSRFDALSDKVADAFLRLHDSNGIDSYGGVVGLLVAWELR